MLNIINHFQTWMAFNCNCSIVFHINVNVLFILLNNLQHITLDSFCLHAFLLKLCHQVERLRTFCVLIAFVLRFEIVPNLFASFIFIILANKFFQIEEQRHAVALVLLVFLSVILKLGIYDFQVVERLIVHSLLIQPPKDPTFQDG